MSTSNTATTTYPFTFTTFSGTPTLSPTTPSSSPTIFPFAPADNCSSTPENPLGLNASCAISNWKGVSDHAFWDLYACCNGAYVTASGVAGTGELCTGSCVAEGQTWQQLMACLEKRAPIVVCKPDFDEIPKDPANMPTSSDSTASATGSGYAISSGGASAASSTGAANAMDAAHATISKTGLAVFAILAVGSVAGLLL